MWLDCDSFFMDPEDRSGPQNEITATTLGPSRNVGRRKQTRSCCSATLAVLQPVCNSDVGNSSSRFQDLPSRGRCAWRRSSDWQRAAVRPHPVMMRRGAPAWPPLGAAREWSLTALRRLGFEIWSRSGRPDRSRREGPSGGSRLLGRCRKSFTAVHAAAGAGESSRLVRQPA